MSLIIQLGNTSPQEIIDNNAVPLNGPAITEIRVDPNEVDGVVRPGYIAGTDVEDILRHMTMFPGPVKHLGGNELVQEIIGQWSYHSLLPPAFVSVIDPGPYDPEDMEDFERFLAEYWDCPQGTPEDLEDVYYTEHPVDGARSRRLFAPGEAPES